MTDRFEEAVREAARGFEGPADFPSYHDAYRRGTRRRLVKRSVLAAAGALVFVAALTINVDLPGNNSTEQDDIALAPEAATPTPAQADPAPSVPPTTAPIESPTSAPTEEATTRAVPTPEPSAEAAASTETATVEAAPTTAAPTSPPQPQPTDPPVQPTPTLPPPTTAPTPEPEPDPTPAFTVGPLEVAPTPETFQLPSPTEVADGAGPAGTGEAPDVATLEAEDTSSIAASILDDRPDATIVDQPVGPGGLECDLDHDGVPDAACSLLADYPCTGADDARPGYSLFDDDRDGTIDTCRAVGLTMCDTTGDGFSDTPCVIELDQGALEPPVQE